MEIRTMRISRITRADYNPRVELKPGDPVYEKLKSSIQTFGFCEPLIFDSRTGHLVGGHQRLTVLKDLGYTDVAHLEPGFAGWKDAERDIEDVPEHAKWVKRD